MNAKWTWIFGIAGGSSLLLTLIFFAATQEVTGRDLIVLGSGTIVGGMIAAFIATFVFYSKRNEARREGDKSLAAKRADLFRELPLRTEKLAQIKRGVAQNRMEAVTATGNEKAQILETRRAYANGYPQLAVENQANAETWRIKREHLSDELNELEALRSKLESQTDEDYVAEQKHLRGLD